MQARSTRPQRIVVSNGRGKSRTDFDEIEAPGATLLTVVGALGMLPDLVRLLTGRLHRWRLEIGPETVRYRGYRTDVP